MRPLYKPLANDRELGLACRKIGNRGLWNDKFFDLWDDHRTWQMPDGPTKAKWIGMAKSDRCGEVMLLQETAARIEAYVRARKGAIVVAETAERFVTGTGLPHPVENGFLWHHTLGVPYLPGSGVKGVVLSWDRDWANAEHAEDRMKMLGRGPSREPGAAADPGAAGEVAFLDALPPGQVMLDLDGVTPHDTPYLMDADGKTPPADWHSPKPIPFLAVAKGQVFRFPIVPCSEQGERLLTDAVCWLMHALQNLGAGAKTAVDHGRFTIRQVVWPSAAGDEAETAIAVGGASAGVHDLADGEQRPQA